MEITCGDCGTRFRLDVALLQGARGGRIRCRRCGGQIVVSVPEESTIPPAADASGVFRSEPASPPVPPSQETSPPSAVEPVAPAQEWESPWPVEGKEYSRLEDLFAHPPTYEDSVRGNPAKETAEPEPRRKAPSRRASSRSTLPILFVLCVLLLAAAALYFGIPKSGHDISGNLFAGRGSSRTGRAPARPTYDIRNVKWSFEKETVGGTLFVVKGEVTNIGEGPSGGVGIRATLLGKDNQAIAEKTAFAGNVLDEASMRRMDRPAIEGAMSNRFGQGDVNREIPPGKVLPFMVIFFDPPLEIDAVMVKADDAR